MTDAKVAGFDPPALVEPYVMRPRVAAVVEAATRRRVCVVVAAAGWGKTTMLAAWASGRNTVWLRAGQAEGEAREALGLLLAGVADDGGSDEPLGARLRAELGRPAARGDLVVVIDDAQDWVPEDDLARLVEGLCCRTAARLRLLIASRRSLVLDLTRLRGQGLVGEIDAARLAFSGQDVATLMTTVVGDPAPELIEAIGEVTAGWPAAVCMAGQALVGVPAGERLSVVKQLTARDGRLAEYVAREVFAVESEGVRRILQQLACLGEVDEGLCQAAGLEDAVAVLSDLARRGLAAHSFHPAPRGAWSLIGPIRECLRSRFPLSHADQAVLHRRAADCLVERGAFERALGHLRAAADHPGTVAVLLEHGSDLLAAGNCDAVLAAAELPPDYLRDPSLQQLIGHAQLVRGQWEAAGGCFTRASSGQEALSVALAWHMGSLAQARGEFDQALEVYGRAELADEDTPEESLLLSSMATAYRMIGDYQVSSQYATRGKAAADRCDDPAAKAAAHLALSMLAAVEGDHSIADAHATTAFQVATEANAVLEIVRAHVQRSLHLVKQGKPNAAFAEAQRALEMSQGVGYQLMCGIAVTTRGFACLVLGRIQEAASDFETACDLFQATGSRYLAWALCGLGDIQALKGELATARASFEEALALSEPTHEVLGLGAALIGLARVRAADDLELARSLAARAAEVNEGLLQVQVLLTQGWIELMAADHQSAGDYAERAAAVAGRCRDMPGLAEALLLTALSAPEPKEKSALVDEARRRWQEIGNPIEEAVAALIAARLAGPAGQAAAQAAEDALHGHGVKLGAGAAGPLAVLPGTACCHIRIRTLGPFTVTRNDQPIQASVWKSQKARDLLKILIARLGRPVAREELMELLWPNEDPAKTGNRLSVQLSTLRNVLHDNTPGPHSDIVVTDRATIHLDIEHLELDIDDFLKAAQDAIDGDDHDDPAALHRLAAAQARYTGHFLENELDQPWAEPLREHALARHITLLRRLARRLHHAGDIDQALHYLLRLLEHDPYDEQTHLAVVQLLLQAGRHGEARRRYTTYRQRMHEITVTPRPWPATDTP